jgi:hexosaminidase
LDAIFGGTQYRLPPPGAIITGGMLHASTEYPGLVIRYTTDGTDPTAKSAEYTGPVPVSGPVKLATFATSGRASRTSAVE